MDCATHDITAVGGQDHTATSGTLTFASGQRTHTISVPILRDSHDDETFRLTLSTARIADGEATGTIRKTDRMPGAWLTRFGRTASLHAVEALEGWAAWRAPENELTLVYCLK